jgi:hypothetical protein
VTASVADRPQEAHGIVGIEAARVVDAGRLDHAIPVDDERGATSRMPSDARTVADPEYHQARQSGVFVLTIAPVPRPSHMKTLSPIVLTAVLALCASPLFARQDRRCVAMWDDALRARPIHLTNARRIASSSEPGQRESH